MHFQAPLFDCALVGWGAWSFFSVQDLRSTFDIQQNDRNRQQIPAAFR